jgi:hypothetical protein
MPPFSGPEPPCTSIGGGLVFGGKVTIILSSNKTYGEWGDIFSDEVLAAAILDRLLHHSVAISIRGESYRLKDKRKAGVFQAKEVKAEI